MSLHAAIMIPWPANMFKNHSERLKWQLRGARYKVGGGYLSLLQIQHCLIRAAGPKLDLPSLPCPFEVSFIYPNAWCNQLNWYLLSFDGDLPNITRGGASAN